jgi:hypothetical protein
LMNSSGSIPCATLVRSSSDSPQYLRVAVHADQLGCTALRDADKQSVAMVLRLGRCGWPRGALPAPRG